MDKFGHLYILYLADKSEMDKPFVEQLQDFIRDSLAKQNAGLLSEGGLTLLLVNIDNMSSIVGRSFAHSSTHNSPM